jgi:hypothetical protein
MDNSYGHEPFRLRPGSRCLSRSVKYLSPKTVFLNTTTVLDLGLGGFPPFFPEGAPWFNSRQSLLQHTNKRTQTHSHELTRTHTHTHAHIHAHDYEVFGFPPFYSEGGITHPRTHTHTHTHTAIWIVP